MVMRADPIWPYPALGRRGRKEGARRPTLPTVEHHGRRARPIRGLPSCRGLFARPANIHILRDVFTGGHAQVMTGT